MLSISNYAARPMKSFQEFLYETNKMYRIVKIINENLIKRE